MEGYWMFNVDFSLFIFECSISNYISAFVCCFGRVSASAPLLMHHRMALSFHWASLWEVFRWAFIGSLARRCDSCFILNNIASNSAHFAQTANSSVPMAECMYCRLGCSSMAGTLELISTAVRCVVIFSLFPGQSDNRPIVPIKWIDSRINGKKCDIESPRRSTKSSRWRKQEKNVPKFYRIK